MDHYNVADGYKEKKKNSITMIANPKMVSLVMIWAVIGTTAINATMIIEIHCIDTSRHFQKDVMKKNVRNTLIGIEFLGIHQERRSRYSRLKNYILN